MNGIFRSFPVVRISFTSLDRNGLLNRNRPGACFSESVNKSSLKFSTHITMFEAERRRTTKLGASLGDKVITLSLTNKCFILGV